MDVDDGMFPVTFAIVSETYNAWILKQHELPIMQLLNIIRVKQMEMMYKRKQKLIKWKYDVGPKINKILKKRVHKSEGLTVRRSSVSGFEVEGDASTHSVDLSLRSCSCKVWEMTGLPCIHASTAIARIRRQLLNYVSHEYHKEAYAQTYEEPINPVPNHDMSFESPTGDTHVVVRPPRTRKRAGRPKRQRIESQDVEKRPQHCSRCGDPRHNRRSCREAI
ncbi:uncharacterized protein LOC122068795 [Macadamia integrifolia]|uniref:uncharacterized protein LOC122068795 n=1 Tax=Macadamia integrifolia TaxID=60698 RepID=UPI001C4E3CF1|nr:uncharacterized protein LOC122068795 [Macadamia integrifolia]